MNHVVVSVGSNIDPEKNIRKAQEFLLDIIIKVSKFIWTKPQGDKNQDDFLNGAFLISSDMGLGELKDHLKGIEDELGRVRTKNKNGPRTIDLDIVIFNNEIIDNDYYKYDFVKRFVKELIPDMGE